MAVAPINLSMLRGDTASWSLAVTTNGTATNLTGGSLRMTAKYKTDDLDAAKVFVKTIGSGITVTSAANGLATVLLLQTDTNTLPGQIVTLAYDIQFTDTSSPVKVSTVAWGDLTVKPDVSITVP